ncbi:hypothetical protein D3C87_2143800 [compost metagenome]
MRPVSVSSMVRDRPSISRMIHGPVTLAMPALISGCPIFTPSWATRMSPSRLTWKAEPAAVPLSAMTKGFGKLRSRW